MLGFGKMFNAEFTVGVQNDLGRKDLPNGVVWASEYFWVAKRDQGFVIFSHIGGDGGVGGKGGGQGRICTTVSSCVKGTPCNCQLIISP